MFNYRTVYPFGLNRQMCDEFKTEEKHQITESYLALNRAHPRTSMDTNTLCISISNVMCKFHLNKDFSISASIYFRFTVYMLVFCRFTPFESN